MPKINICTKWSQCGKEDYDLTGLYPPPRLYLTSQNGRHRRWGLIVALWRSGKTQWFNPIMRRWTRCWFWFSFIPPDTWTIDNGKLRPMKHPWQPGRNK